VAQPLFAGLAATRRPMSRHNESIGQLNPQTKKWRSWPNTKAYLRDNPPGPRVIWRIRRSLTAMYSAAFVDELVQLDLKRRHLL